jgi:maltoporin
VRFFICASESRLEGVNRRNLKIINFKHALHSGLGLEINNSEIGVRKIVLAISCSINADNFGSKLKMMWAREL